MRDIAADHRTKESAEPAVAKGRQRAIERPGAATFGADLDERRPTRRTGFLPAFADSLVDGPVGVGLVPSSVHEPLLHALRRRVTKEPDHGDSERATKIQERPSHHLVGKARVDD